MVCIDRFCRTSKHSYLRSFATLHTAHRIILITIILISLIYIHIPLQYTIVHSICMPLNLSYYRFLGYFLLIFYCLLPPTLMSIFSTWTLIPLRRRRQKQQKKYQLRIILPRKRRHYRVYQLMKILFLYVTTNIICILPFSILVFT